MTNAYEQTMINIKPSPEEARSIRKRYSFIALMMLLHMAIYNIVPRVILLIAGLANGAQGGYTEIMKAGSQFAGEHDAIFTPLRVAVILLSEIIPVLIGCKCLKIDLKGLFGISEFSARDLGTSVAFGLGTQAAASVITTVIVIAYTIIAGEPMEQPISTSMSSPFGTVIYWTYACILGPVCEEIFMRGFLLSALKKYGDMFAAVFSGILFGLFHENLYQASYAIPMGIFLAVVALKTKSIVPTIYMHIVCNTTNMVMVQWMMSKLGTNDTSKIMEIVMSGDTGYMAPLIVNLLWRACFIAVFIAMTVVMFGREGKWRIGRATPAGKERTWKLMLTSFFLPVLMFLVGIIIYDLFI